MGKVQISGTGITKVGDHWSDSIINLAINAGREALRDSGKMPEMIVVGNMLSSLTSRQENLGVMIADGLGLAGIPAFKVEAGSCSGAMACHLASQMVKNGSYASVLVIGVEKMMDLSPGEIIRAQSMAENSEFSQFFGITNSALAAMLTKLYVQEYEIKRRDMSSFPVIAHRNSINSKHAKFRREISLDDVEKSPNISDPLRLLDCAPSGDGAASVLLTGGNDPGSSTNAVEILGSASATASPNFYERDNMMDFEATRVAAIKAISESGVSITEIDLMEIHDVYSVIAALTLEALGISKKGDAARDASNGKFDLDSRPAISTFGGLKARGNPLGATGIYQIVEVVRQLQGRAEENQISNARIGLTHNATGMDSNAVIHVLGGRG